MKSPARLPGPISPEPVRIPSSPGFCQGKREGLVDRHRAALFFGLLEPLGAESFARLVLVTIEARAIRRGQRYAEPAPDSLGRADQARAPYRITTGRGEPGERAENLCRAVPIPEVPEDLERAHQQRARLAELARIERGHAQGVEVDGGAPLVAALGIERQPLLEHRPAFRGITFVELEAPEVVQNGRLARLVAKPSADRERFLPQRPRARAVPTIPNGRSPAVQCGGRTALVPEKPVQSHCLFEEPGGARRFCALVEQDAEPPKQHRAQV